MGYFPLYIDMANKKCVVIGGGKIAYRKIKTLLELDAVITVISPQLIDEIKLLQNKVELVEKEFDINDIKNAFLVVCATNDSSVNNMVSKVCFENNILVNVTDDIDNCNFIFPAVVKKDDIIIGVSTSGNSPIMSKVIRDEIEDNIPEFYAPLVKKLGSIRKNLKKKISDEKIRVKTLNKISEIALENKGEISDELINNIVEGGCNEKNN